MLASGGCVLLDAPYFPRSVARGCRFARFERHAEFDCKILTHSCDAGDQCSVLLPPPTRSLSLSTPSSLTLSLSQGLLHNFRVDHRERTQVWGHDEGCSVQEVGTIVATAASTDDRRWGRTRSPTSSSASMKYVNFYVNIDHNGQHRQCHLILDQLYRQLMPPTTDGTVPARAYSAVSGLNAFTPSSFHSTSSIAPSILLVDLSIAVVCRR